MMIVVVFAGKNMPVIELATGGSSAKNTEVFANPHLLKELQLTQASIAKSSIFSRLPGEISYSILSIDSKRALL